MKVITSNPIISAAEWDEEYANLFGANARRRRDMRRQSRRRKKRSKRSERDRRRAQGGGGFFQKVAQGVQNLSQSGALNNLGGGMGMGGFNDGFGGGFNDPTMGGFNDPTMGMNTFTPNVNQRRGLSQGAKIAIGVGIAALVGVGIYYATKKKGGGKKSSSKAK